MQLFVEMPAGGTIVVEVEPGASVASLMHEATPEGRNYEQCYMQHGGRVLQQFRSLVDCGVRELSTLRMGLRIRGGGGDGGATGAESRDCYLKMYAIKKPDKVDPYEQKLAKWTQCSLSSDVLKPPCVMDLLGNLFNKEGIVQGLITKTLPKRLGHIKSLKDVVDLKLSSIPGVASDDDISAAKFQCPVTGLEMNGKFKFYTLRVCGHVLSARAFKEVGATSCAVCLSPFTEAYKIVVNGSEEEVAQLRQRLEDEKAAKAKIRGDRRCKKELMEVADDRTHLRNVESKRKGPAEVVPVVRPVGSDLVQTVKRFKAGDHIPVNATKEVYASIFTSSRKVEFKETYSCRSLPLGRN